MAATSLVAKLFAGKACALSLGHGFGGSLVARSGVASCAIVPRKTFITSAAKPRIYGPEPLNERKDEVHHWTNERYVALALVPIIPTALAFPNIVLDTALCGAMILHTHWRLSGVAQDYIHGGAYQFVKYLVLALSITSFSSLCYFNYADVGFGRAVNLIYRQL
jgi:succinate dehydrogenase (ubiquinone) membrane anchor subunit